MTSQCCFFPSLWLLNGVSIFSDIAALLFLFEKGGNPTVSRSPGAGEIPLSRNVTPRAGHQLNRIKNDEPFSKNLAASVWFLLGYFFHSRFSFTVAFLTERKKGQTNSLESSEPLWMKSGLTD